ncbi:MAG: 4-(cytidine 5'-diphospho)-2-C-methyl-D-erythritol kinase [Acidobacteria bacterium]|nr:4-(cytidine 5'-diphospho)-2-C-methyl-D-erythritol kinase [Acidobacteriota bacterium]
MLLRAFAKINLDLRVLGRRDDGYHEVRTILQTIDWWDEILVEPATGFEFSATKGPEDETNLVVRAVRSYEQLTGVTANVRIRLIKNIPIGRGLGGGSSDAAVTFMGLQRIYKRGLDREGVFQALSGLGSDVPFFAIAGRAIGAGRGDVVEAIEDDIAYWLTIVDPGFTIATAEAYSWLTVPPKSNNIEGFRAQSACDHEAELRRERLRTQARQGAAIMMNDFEVPVFGRYPILAEIRDELLKLGAFRAALSGSGSAMFGQFRTETKALRAALALSKRYEVQLTKPLPASEYFERIVEE